MNTSKRFCSILLPIGMTVAAATAMAYPLDGYEETGIRRVEGARLANDGLAIGGFQPPGATLTTEQVDLRLLGREISLPPADPEFTARVSALLGDDTGRYGVAVLDLSDPENLRYAEHRGDFRQNVGSVGKLLVALGLSGPKRRRRSGRCHHRARR